MMTTELGLNDAHSFMLTQWLAFARKERDIRMAAVKELFQKAMKKVNKDGNSRAEVYKILEQMQTLVLTEMEGELINMSHNTFLLARQLIRQAEIGGLSVKMNLSEIQNVEMLKAVAIFEREVAQKKQTRVETILRDPTLIDAAVNSLSSDFVAEFYREDLENMAKHFQQSSLTSEATLTQIQREMQAKEKELGRIEDFQKQEQKRIQSMEKNHLEMKKRIDDITKQLALKEAELEKKFQSTNTYINMQKILNSKNAQIKRLREGKQAPEADEDVESD